MVIWGSKGKSKTIGSGTFYCPHCKSHQLFKHEELSRYFTLYFIPLFKTQNLGEYIECQTCLKTFKKEVLQYSQQFDSGTDNYASEPQFSSSSVQSTTYAPNSSPSYSQTSYQSAPKKDKLYGFVKVVFGLVGAIFIFSIFYYLTSMDTSSASSSVCSGQDVDRWFDQSYAIFEASDADYVAIDDIEYYDQFAPFASRAENRYWDHKRLNTPDCLQTIKDLSDQFLFIEWKMYQAATEGDFDSAMDYETEVGQIGEQITSEIDLLYGD
jgi:hypothetical protein